MRAKNTLKLCLSRQTASLKARPGGGGAGTPSTAAPIDGPLSLPLPPTTGNHRIQQIH